MRRHHVEALLIWILVVALWIYTSTYDRPILGSEISIIAWPRGLLILVALAALLHLLTEARRENYAPRGTIHGSENVKALQGQRERIRLSFAENLRPAAWTLLTLSIPLAYVWSLPYYGFFITTPIFVVAMMLAFRERRWFHLCVTSLIIVFSITFIFTKLLFLPLPTGNVSGFYEVNVKIVKILRNM